jgi:hypothetical protein
MLVSDRELVDPADHVKQRARVGHLLAPAEPQAYAVLAAELVERLDLRQVVAELGRVGGEHAIVTTSGHRLDQVSQLAAGLAGVGVDDGLRPAQLVLGQADHHGAFGGHVVDGRRVRVAHVGSGPGRNGGAGWKGSHAISSLGATSGGDARSPAELTITSASDNGASGGLKIRRELTGNVGTTR